MDELAVVGDLLSDDGFLTGLAVGAGVLLVFFLVARVTGGPVPGWAFAFTLATFALLTSRFDVDGAVTIGLGVSAIAGFVVGVATSSGDGGRRLGPLAWVVVLGALVWMASQLEVEGGETWFLAVLPVVVVAAAYSLHAAKSPPLLWSLGPLLAVSVAGIWVTVPETDMVTVLFGVSLPMALATLPFVNGRAIAAGIVPLAALIAWLTTTGGVTTPTTIIGGWASLGVILLIPMLEVESRRAPGPRLLIGTQVVYVVVITRVVDYWDSILGILAVGVFLLAGAYWLLSSLGRRRDDSIEHPAESLG